MLLEMVPDMSRMFRKEISWRGTPCPMPSILTLYPISRPAKPSRRSRAYGIGRPPEIRTEFDKITATMTSILTAVGEAMRENPPGRDPTPRWPSRPRSGSSRWVALAGDIINGGTDADVETIVASEFQTCARR